MPKSSLLTLWGVIFMAACSFAQTPPVTTVFATPPPAFGHQSANRFLIAGPAALPEWAMTRRETSNAPALIPVAPSNSIENTFLKKYGAPDTGDAGYTLCPSGDGNLYLAGLKDKRTFLLKINPDGAVLWMRSFVVNPFEPVVPSDLILDSEGMLVGCGTTGLVLGLHKGFVFRYNPATNALLWTQTIVSNRPQSAGLIEKEPGGNFLFLQTPQPGNDLETEWLELNRLTGALVPPLTKRYRFNRVISVAAAAQYNGALYGVGHSLGREYSPDSNNVRHLLLKTDLATGAVQWANLSYADTADFAIAQSGRDLLIEADTIVTVGGFAVRGANNGFDQGGMYLQKNNLDGDILWAKRYPLVGDPDALIRFGDGYVISGILSTNSQFILRVDRDGVPLWARRLDLDFSSFTSFSGNTFQHNLVAMGDYLYLAVPTDPQEKNDAYLLKIDADGNISGSCDFLKPLPVSMETILSPKNFAIAPAVLNSPAAATPAIVPVVQGQLAAVPLCPPNCADSLNLGADQSRCTGDTIMLHAGPHFAKYLWQDGSTAHTITAAVAGLYWVEVTDSCGNVQRDSVTLSYRPQETLFDSLYFCPGDTVVLGGVAYTLPGVVHDTLPGTAGDCDTLVTTNLLYLNDGQVSALTLHCPANLTVTLPAGASSTVVDFDPPAPASDCFCPGIVLTQTNGLPGGSAFPLGITPICFAAQDYCGATASCCFQVEVQAAPAPAEACDVKSNGCVVFELLSVSRDPLLRKTYRFRITNQCTQNLQSALFQLPDGVVAADPASNSLYTAPSGRTYTVRNPNFSPFYSVRFSAQNTGAAPGQSDEFAFTLPAQADPVFIHALVRLAGQGYIETHLNVFDCPVVDKASKVAARGQYGVAQALSPAVSLYPNPSVGRLSVALTAFADEPVHYRLINMQGRVCQTGVWPAAGEIPEMALPGDLPDGVYWLECRDAAGNSAGQRFVLRR